MPDFRSLSQSVLASPQIGAEDVAAAKEMGVVGIVNNRPDGEDPSALQSEAVEALARDAGLDYNAIPIGHSGFSEAQIDEMIKVMSNASGPVLAYCRSGTRSTFLWALAQAKTGGSPEDISKAAAAAGYDVSPIGPMLDMLAAR